MSDDEDHEDQLFADARETSIFDDDPGPQSTAHNLDANTEVAPVQTEPVLAGGEDSGVTTTEEAVAPMTDGGLWADRLGRRANLLLHVDISLSLGYFSFALPISLHMVLGLKARKPYSSPQLCLHHAMVVVAQLTFLLSG